MAIHQTRYLVAEDHDFQRGILVTMIKGIGAQDVHEASNGQDALSIFLNPAHQIDIVLSDLEMPGMDGMAFIRHLGESGRPVSLIITSSMERKLLDSVATMTEAYCIELLGVIEKPVSRRKLLPLINSYKRPEPKPPPSRGAVPTFALEEIVRGLKSNEFEPFYQPKIEMASGRIKGAEALARWRHPQYGFVAPYAFIKPLEDNGLIDPLTWTMLRKSAAFCKKWRESGADVTMSVNLSLKSLVDPELADRVIKIVREQNVDPCCLVLEVTESSTTTNVGLALENLARLRMKGFGLSIDDYGTGYSSMQQLTRIAFTELKIDQSFVTNAAKQEAARTILVSSLRLAKELNITAVAEGVETQQDWDLLANLGCDVVQGYFIARPMEGLGFLDWTRTW